MTSQTPGNDADHKRAEADLIASKQSCSTDQKATFKPSDDEIRAAENTFVAMAHLALIKPQVRAYQRAILADGKWPVDEEKFKEPIERRGGCVEEFITDPEHSYLMSPSDFTIYDARCRAARRDANLFVEKDELCPLCVAQHLLIEAEYCMLLTIAPRLKITEAQIQEMRMDLRKEMLELTLQLLGPLVRSSNEVLDRYKAAA